jgi:preprotein translocase subunit SecE
MKRIIAFFQESFAELKKVTWPSRDEAVASTKVVLVSTLLIAAMLGLVDLILFKIIDWLFK